MATTRQEGMSSATVALVNTASRVSPLVGWRLVHIEQSRPDSVHVGSVVHVSIRP